VNVNVSIPSLDGLNPSRVFCWLVSRADALNAVRADRVGLIFPSLNLFVNIHETNDPSARTKAKIERCEDS
jgi:hypothetical protein